jgi:hypothetical protein
MPRCDRPARPAWAWALATLATLALPALLASPLAMAQTPRSFDAQTLRGELVITQPPEVLLNGQPARLAPGARIRASNNLLALSGELAGQRLRVNYTLDFSGHVLNVWVLTPGEAARKPWPTTPQQAQAWQFNAAQQTWSPR